VHSEVLNFLGPSELGYQQLSDAVVKTVAGTSPSSPDCVAASGAAPARADQRIRVHAPLQFLTGERAHHRLANPRAGDIVVARKGTRS
jgi:hypothetical protein